MKPSAFDYEEPDDLAEAIELLTADDEARALAGGQESRSDAQLQVRAADHARGAPAH